MTERAKTALSNSPVLDNLVSSSLREASQCPKILKALIFICCRKHSLITALALRLWSLHSQRIMACGWKRLHPSLLSPQLHQIGQNVSTNFAPIVEQPVERPKIQRKDNCKIFVKFTTFRSFRKYDKLDGLKYVLLNSYSLSQHNLAGRKKNQKRTRQAAHSE